MCLAYLQREMSKTMCTSRLSHPHAPAAWPRWTPRNFWKARKLNDRKTRYGIDSTGVYGKIFRRSCFSSIHRLYKRHNSSKPILGGFTLTMERMREQFLSDVRQSPRTRL